MPMLPVPPKVLLLGAVLCALLFALGYLVYLAARIAWIHKEARRKNLSCPHCGGVDIRHSHGSRWPDVLYLLGACVPYRCRACRCRFYRPQAKGLEAISKTVREEPRPRRGQGQRVLLATILCCVPLLLAVPVYYRFRTVVFGTPPLPQNERDAGLVLSEASFQGTGAGRTIHGTVRNVSAKEYRGVQVAFNLSSATRQRIGRVLAGIESIGPNATAPFRTAPVPEAAIRMELRSIDGTPR
jgi:hypothetical protein